MNVRVRLPVAPALLTSPATAQTAATHSIASPSLLTMIQARTTSPGQQSTAWDDLPVRARGSGTRQSR